MTKGIWQSVISVAALLLTGPLLTACSETSRTSSYAAPDSSLTICSGYGCVIKDKMRFTGTQRNNLEAILKSGHSDPASERKAIARAIGTMERYTIANLGLPVDVRQAYQRHRHLRGQMDCVDESLNTTVYLTWLQARGWLKHHKPRGYFAERGLLVDGRYPHKSAVMIELQNGKRWSVDGWYGDGGEEPDIHPLSKWQRWKGRIPS